LISYATEAHLFIKDLNQSPFNIGVRVNLRDFNEAETSELGRRYGSLVAAHSADVFAITCGHPYLSRRAYGFLAGGGTVSELRELAPKEGGPFGDHLRHMLAAIRREPETLNEVRRMLRNEGIADNNTKERLLAAGLLTVGGEREPEFRVPAYASYLRAALG
jgi:hypothetical protein